MSDQVSFKRKCRPVFFLGLFVVCVIGCDLPKRDAVEVAVEETAPAAKVGNAETALDSPSVSSPEKVLSPEIELTPALAKFLLKFKSTM